MIFSSTPEPIGNGALISGVDPFGRVAYRLRTFREVCTFDASTASRARFADASDKRVTR